MQVYECKAVTVSGTSYKEVWKNAWKVFNLVQKKSKRTPYVRSSYFDKQKVFCNRFSPHLHKKIAPERMRRLRYLAAALELIAQTRIKATSKTDPHKKNIVWHRFIGRTADKKLFYVQIKENTSRKTLHFMSCFGKR